MNDKNTLVLSRQFNAPRNLVWKAWTDADHLAQWFSPAGFTVQVHKLTLVPGGIFLYSIRNADGFEMWGKWLFRAIEEPARLEVIQGFSDANGGDTRHPAATSWPLHTLSIMTLVEQNNGTLLTLEWSPYEATPAETTAFTNEFDGMNEGWDGTLKHLESYLQNYLQKNRPDVPG